AEAGAGRAVGRRATELARATAALESAEATRRARGRALFVDFEAAPRRVVLTIDAPEIRAGERSILRDVRLSLGRSDRVRLCGPNGAGKTTLLARLLRGGDRRVLFVPQEIPARGTARAIDELRALPREAKGRALSLIAALGADPGRILGAGAASPGEARQLAIAAGLAARAHTVVLDEPTNDLDLPAIERLEDALASFPGALLIVTHDDALASRLTLDEWRIEGQHVRV
ncbi:MAG: ABC transporter ATP-binding protein, partial [Myxococcota bacterium]|nr:ABC transporter ATP-binding protein [Myxococcota bacterium]